MKHILATNSKLEYFLKELLIFRYNFSKADFREYHLMIFNLFSIKQKKMIVLVISQNVINLFVSKKFSMDFFFFQIKFHRKEKFHKTGLVPHHSTKIFLPILVFLQGFILAKYNKEKNPIK